MLWGMNQSWNSTYYGFSCFLLATTEAFSGLLDRGAEERISYTCILTWKTVGFFLWGTLSRSGNRETESGWYSISWLCFFCCFCLLDLLDDQPNLNTNNKSRPKFFENWSMSWSLCWLLCINDQTIKWSCDMLWIFVMGNILPSESVLSSIFTFLHLPGVHLKHVADGWKLPHKSKVVSPHLEPHP